LTNGRVHLRTCRQRPVVGEAIRVEPQAGQEGTAVRRVVRDNPQDPCVVLRILPNDQNDADPSRGRTPADGRPVGIELGARKMAMTVDHLEKAVNHEGHERNTKSEDDIPRTQSPVPGMCIRVPS